MLLHVDRRDRIKLLRQDRRQRTALGVLIALGLTALIATGSSCAAPKRVEAAGTALRALEVSSRAFESWSEAYQMAMVEAAEVEGRDPAVLKAQLRAFRTARDKVRFATYAAADLVSIAMLDPSLANLGRAVQAVKDVLASTRALRGP